jgi:hypothetical protein
MAKWNLGFVLFTGGVFLLSGYIQCVVNVVDIIDMEGRELEVENYFRWAHYYYYYYYYFLYIRELYANTGQGITSSAVMEGILWYAPNVLSFCRMGRAYYLLFRTDSLYLNLVKNYTVWEKQLIPPFPVILLIHGKFSYMFLFKAPNIETTPEIFRKICGLRSALILPLSVRLKLDTVIIIF